MNERAATLQPGAAALTAASIAVMFLVSDLMLGLFGIAYDRAGGALWQKIHPATYLALLAAALALWPPERGMQLIAGTVMRQPGLIVFAAAFALLLAHTILFAGYPITLVTDTFLPALILAVLAPRLGADWRMRLAVLIHIVMAANAVLGLAEVALSFRLTPLIANDVVLTDWRSTALLGHPLQNAATTGLYVLVLLTRMEAPGLARGFVWPMVILQAAAMMVFGGRLATALLALFAAIILFWRFLNFLRAPRLTRAGAATLVLGVCAGAIALGGLFAAGFFDQFIQRFVEDEGSAAARLAMFNLIGELQMQDFLFGTPPQTLASLQRLHGIAFGIESFWIAFIAAYGLIVSLMFFAGLLALLYEIMRASGRGGAAGLLFFLLVCSGSLSLAGKSMMLAMSAAMILILCAPALKPAGRAPVQGQ